MLIDDKVCMKLLLAYKMSKEAGPVIRYGIVCGDADYKEAFVEVYLKKFDIMCFPNANKFNFKVPRSVYMSKMQTIDDFNLKVRRCANGYLAAKREMPVGAKARLWKSMLNDMEYLNGLDKKYQDYTETKIDAYPLVPISGDQSKIVTAGKTLVDTLEITPGEDIILVEFTKAKTQDWTFRPKNATDAEE
jgi:hypothetical protein